MSDPAPMLKCRRDRKTYIMHCQRTQCFLRKKKNEISITHNLIWIIFLNFFLTLSLLSDLIIYVTPVSHRIPGVDQQVLLGRERLPFHKGFLQQKRWQISDFLIWLMGNSLWTSISIGISNYKSPQDKIVKIENLDFWVGVY